MNIIRIPLNSYSRFHFGEMKLDHDLALTDSSYIAHSDTLFSGLVNSYSLLTENGQGFIDLFEKGDLRISSLFYYISNVASERQYVYFLPKPLFLAATSFKTPDGNHKKRNRIQFVSLGVWKAGFEPERWLDESAYIIIQDTFVITRSEYDLLGFDPEKDADEIQITSKTLNPRSPQRAHNKNAAIYYQTDIEIGNNPGLEIGWYYMYEGTEEASKMLKVATNVLVYTGIGGEITTMGRTVPERPNDGEIDLDMLGSSEFGINVGLLNPKDENEFQKVSYYQTIFRGGRTGAKNSDGHADVVRMLKEGALIKGNNVEGRLVILGKDQLDRPLYRNGKTLIIPFNYDVSTPEL